jgi:hypothetical protein
LVQISTAYGVRQEGSTVLPRNKYTANHNFMSAITAASATTFEASATQAS